MKSKIKVVIADNQNLICDGIRIILDSQPDMEVVATADNGLKAVEHVSAFRPDIVLMDIKMPVMSGIEALKAIKSKYPETLVLMLTTFDPDEYVLGAFKNGADGYLLKDITSEKLTAAVRNACSGNVTIPAAIASRILAQVPGEVCKKNLVDYCLTNRETEIAGLLARGYSNLKIAASLDITEGTVKNYISTIYSKLEVNNREEAICIIKGIISKEK